MTHENGLASTIVLVGVMLAPASAHAAQVREDPLSSGTSVTAAERVLQLAEAELDRAYRLAGLILRDQHEAEDATQEALLRAWRSASMLRDPADFQAWFDRILVNGCRDRLRRRGRVRLIPMDEFTTTGAFGDPFRLVLDRDEVLGVMDVLNDDLRIVIVLHYWADLTLEDVARRVGRPVGTVKSRLHRALEIMRDQLDKAGLAEVVR